jgi:hypothetical protein
MKIAKFAKNNVPLCIGTLGLAIVSYMGYCAIQKCCKSHQVHALTRKIPKALHPSAPKKHWWTKVTETKDFAHFKKNWKHLAKYETARQREAAKLKASYYSKNRPSSDPSNYHAPFGTVYSIPANFSLWMPGVALVAAYLAEKKKVEGLFVCESLEGLSKKIQEISQNPADQKAAFVVGAFSSGLKKQIPFGFEPNFPQHKVAVCVEKKEGKLSIALLDSQPVPENKTIHPENLQGEIWKGYDQWDKFNAQEVVMRAILKGCREAKADARLLHSQVLVQQGLGCETFALKNGISFLRDPHFFSHITCSKTKTVTVDPQYNIEVIKRLPPQYMVGAQSIQILESYKRNGGQFHQPLPGKKKTLQNYLDAHLIKGSNGKVQNHYITKKSFKYLKFATLAHEKLKAHEIDAIISKTLVK